MPTTAHDISILFVELGLAIIGLAIIARLANRWGFSAIPLYLLAGLAFGNGGLAPLSLSRDFIHIGAEIGVLLLLFMLGLEYSAEEFKKNLRGNVPAGIADFLLNFTPGILTGLLLRWKPLPAVLLGGITYISSSGIVAKVLSDLKRLNNPETPVSCRYWCLRTLPWLCICLWSECSLQAVVRRRLLFQSRSPFWRSSWFSSLPCATARD